MNKIHGRRRLQVALVAGAAGLGLVPETALADDQTATIAALQRQIDELRAQVQLLTAAQTPREPAPAVVAAPPPAAVPATAVVSPAGVPPSATPPAASEKKAWYEKLQVRGYVQMRTNEVLSGVTDAPPGVARLRSVHDSSLGEKGTFSTRRARLVVQGDISDRVSVYFQSDFANAVNNQSNGERRENFAQLRDAYADLHFADKAFKLRFGQSKVPFGWENLQSSSNRLAIDRADAANGAVPGERDLGIIAYYTPPHVQAIWDELSHDGQKLFGNYGAFGLGLFNGQGTNRAEKNDGLMKVALATWPIRLSDDHVLELGVQGMLNRVQPEVRSGGVSADSFKEKRVNLHAVLYPNPLGFQAEWTWGRGPAWSQAAQAITEQDLSGGYFQTMYRIKHSPIGALMPYARWQRYRGGWKSATNAPLLATDEIELGIEWQPLKELELTVAYAKMKRAEADERRTGRASGSVIRTQLQWNY